MTNDIRTLAAIYRERAAKYPTFPTVTMFEPPYSTVDILLTGNVGRLYLTDTSRNYSKRVPSPWFGGSLFGNAAKRDGITDEYRATLCMWQGEMTYRWRRIAKV